MASVYEALSKSIVDNDGADELKNAVETSKNIVETTGKKYESITEAISNLKGVVDASLDIWNKKTQLDKIAIQDEKQKEKVEEEKNKINNQAVKLSETYEAQKKAEEEKNKSIKQQNKKLEENQINNQLNNQNIKNKQNFLNEQGANSQTYTEQNTANAQEYFKENFDRAINEDNNKKVRENTGFTNLEEGLAVIYSQISKITGINNHKFIRNFIADSRYRDIVLNNYDKLKNKDPLVGIMKNFYFDKNNEDLLSLAGSIFGLEDDYNNAKSGIFTPQGAYDIASSIKNSSDLFPDITTQELANRIQSGNFGMKQNETYPEYSARQTKAKREEIDSIVESAKNREEHSNPAPDDKPNGSINPAQPRVDDKPEENKEKATEFNSQDDEDYDYNETIKTILSDIDTQRGFAQQSERIHKNAEKITSEIEKLKTFDSTPPMAGDLSVSFDGKHITTKSFNPSIITVKGATLSKEEVDLFNAISALNGENKIKNIDNRNQYVFNRSAYNKVIDTKINFEELKSKIKPEYHKIIDDIENVQNDLKDYHIKSNRGAKLLDFQEKNFKKLEENIKRGKENPTTNSPEESKNILYSMKNSIGKYNKNTALLYGLKEDKESGKYTSTEKTNFIVSLTDKKIYTYNGKGNKTEVETKKERNDIAYLKYFLNEVIDSDRSKKGIINDMITTISNSLNEEIIKVEKGKELSDSEIENIARRISKVVTDKFNPGDIVTKDNLVISKEMLGDYITFAIKSGGNLIYNGKGGYANLKDVVRLIDTLENYGK